MDDHISESATGSISESVVQESVLGDGLEGGWSEEVLGGGVIRSPRPARSFDRGAGFG